MKKVLKQKKGITLIALVITIIVLLILAGISISMLTGDNSILQKATDAKTKSEETQIKERVRLAYNSALTRDLTNGNGNLTKSTLDEEINNEFGASGKVEDDGNYWVIYVDNTERERIEKVIANNKVNNPYKDKEMINAWAYSIDNGWEGPLVDETTISNAIIIVKLYDKGEITINNEDETAYSMVIEGTGAVLLGCNSIKYASITTNDLFRVAIATAPPGAPWETFIPNVIEAIVCDGVTNLPSGFFAEYTNLQSIQLAETLTSLEDFTFQNCSNLNRIIIPEGITSIGTGCFRDCTNLSEISLPNSLTSIGNQTFSSCSKLNYIKIKNNVTYIGENAFAGCNGITIEVQNNYSSGAPWCLTPLLERSTEEIDNYYIKIIWNDETRYYSRKST